MHKTVVEIAWRRFLKFMILVSFLLSSTSAWASQVQFGSHVYGLSFSPVETKLAVNYGGSIQIINWDTGALEQNIVAHNPTSFGSAYFSPDGKYLIANFSSYPQVQVYEIQTEKKVFEKGFPGGIGDIDDSGKYVAIFNGTANAVDIYDLSTGTLLSRIRDQGASMMRNFAFVPGEKSIYTLGYENCALKKWSFIDGSMLSKNVDEYCADYLKFDTRTNLPIVNNGYFLKRLTSKGWQNLAVRNVYYPPETRIETSRLIENFWQTKDLIAIKGGGPKGGEETCIRIFGSDSNFELKRFCAEKGTSINATLLNGQLFVSKWKATTLDIFPWQNSNQ